MLPPEIISGQIYSGLGAQPLLEAARAWSNLATDLQQSAISYRNVLIGIADVWQGPSQQAMASAMAPFVNWLESTASSARQSALATANAASAYEQALVAVVPPPVIASNRAQLMMLVASNLLGQNTSAIAALEAQYEAMWAQDEMAMNTYQVDSSASVGQLPTFSAAPQVATPVAAAVTDPTGLGGLVTTLLTDVENLPVVVAISTALGTTPVALVSDYLQALIGGGFPISLIQLFSSFFGPFLGSSIVAGEVGAQNAIIASKPSVPSVVYPPVPTSPESPKVSASSGTANRIGPMRVPPSWTQPQQQPTVATPLTPSGGNSERRVPLGIPFIPAVPVVGGKTGRKKGTQFEDLDYGEPVPPLLNRHPSGG